MPGPVATWNSQRDVWELETMDLFSGHSDVFSETWPISGTTRAGRAYARPMWAHLTAGSESSSSPGLLPTPAAGNFNDGESVESWQARKERQQARGINGNGMGTPLAVAVQLLPTPRTTDGNGPGVHGTGGQDLRTTVTLLPTPTAMDSHASGGNSPSNVTLTDAVVRTEMGTQANPRLLPTVRATRGGSSTETMYLLSSGGRTRKPSGGGNE